jgi:hypothetical protein
MPDIPEESADLGLVFGTRGDLTFVRVVVSANPQDDFVSLDQTFMVWTASSLHAPPTFT